jgi:hypothetical protein
LLQEANMATARIEKITFFMVFLNIIFLRL